MTPLTPSQRLDIELDEAYVDAYEPIKHLSRAQRRSKAGKALIKTCDETYQHSRAYITAKYKE